MKRLFGYLSLMCLVLSCNNDNKDSIDDSLQSSYSKVPEPVNISYNIIAQYPKDTSAYTQGLEINNGKMYESTGDFENSSMRIVNFKTGAVEQKKLMGSTNIFGEGITIFKDKIYQLTWVSNIVYVYGANNIQKPIKTLNWDNQGWGITHDSTHLIISTGSDTLYFVDPESLAIKKQLPVVSYKGPITQLNELEYIKGFIYANVYTQNYIVKIDPATGYVVGVIVLENLLQPGERTPRTDFLNGIAYDEATQNLLITGKRWPKLFEIKLN